MAPPTGAQDFTDGRKLWDWQSRYPKEARHSINCEAVILAFALVTSSIAAAIALCYATSLINLPALPSISGTGSSNGKPSAPLQIDLRLAGIFFSGCVGGSTFSIKWLIHSVAKGVWHLDRRYWRFFVPLIGGVYACVVLTLFDAGVIGGHAAAEPRPIATAAAFAFMIGYFSDGVSGLLTNIANAVFGTLKEK
jgi:hypothetical protein